VTRGWRVERYRNELQHELPEVDEQLVKQRKELNVLLKDLGILEKKEELVEKMDKRRSSKADLVLEEFFASSPLVKNLEDNKAALEQRQRELAVLAEGLTTQEQREKANWREHL